MSFVLATRITSKMINRSGYIPLDSFDDVIGITDDMFSFYTFNQCIKVKEADFDTWLLYYEGTDTVIKCNVKAEKLANGFVKVLVLNKEEHTLSSIGDMGSKKITKGHIINGKFIELNKVQKTVNKLLFENSAVTVAPKVQKRKETKVQTSDITELKSLIAKNWNITLKSS